MNGYSKSPNCDPRWRRLRHRLRENDIEATIVHVCFYVLILEETLTSSPGVGCQVSAYLQTLWQRERPREFTVPTLTERISLLLTLGGLLRLTRHGEDVVINVD